MQVERVVRLMPVQEHGYRNDGDVSQAQRGGHVAPPRQVEYAGEQHLATADRGTVDDGFQAGMRMQMECHEPMLTGTTARVNCIIPPMYNE